MKGYTKRALFKEPRRSGARRLLLLLTLLFGLICYIGLMADDSSVPLDLFRALPVFSDAAR